MKVYLSLCICLLHLMVGKLVSAQPGVALPDSIIYSTQMSASDSVVQPNNQLFTVRSIIISGNKKTHPDIILRELPFEIDEAYNLEVIPQKFSKARKQLMNTGLFREVTVSLKSMQGYDVYVNVEVDEKWYLWPRPFARPVDKTFHEWWDDQDRDMNRINYGMRVLHNNFTGRNDKLRVNVMNGYTKQLSIQYFGLFLDNDLKWSVNGGVAIGKNREVNYMTERNRPVPIKDRDRYLRSYFNWFGEVSFRPAIKARHTFGIGYSMENVADTVFKLNPEFSSRKSYGYPEIFYRMTYFDVDFIPYPTKGFIGEIMLRRKGLNDPLRMWQLQAKGSKTWPLGTEKMFFNASAVGMVKLPFKQPYVTNQFIGYDGQYLQGYEYYVIDGVAGAYTKATLTRELVNTRISINSKKIPRLNHIPFRIYAKTFVNAGYVYNDHEGINQLNNRLLYSGGVGLDIVVFTDFVIKLDWSFNRLGENGLYLHKRNYF